MRDANRLDRVYELVKYLHKTYLPDMRVMQLMNNFLTWHYNKYKQDGFYIEEPEFVMRFKNFIRDISGDYFD